MFRYRCQWDATRNRNTPSRTPHTKSEPGLFVERAGTDPKTSLIRIGHFSLTQHHMSKPNVKNQILFLNINHGNLK